MGKILITIVGPTAVGKTSLAIKLAKHYKTEVISADSRQFYKELNIGTAKPSKNQLKAVKHHLINNISIEKDYNISDFEKDATISINQVFKNNDYAILVGGSGLYIDAVLYGIDKIPKVDSSIRKKLNKEFDKNGNVNLIKKLKELDPITESKIDGNNHRRIIRALEVCISTKKPYSSFLKYQRTTSKYNEIILGVNMDRKKLHLLINKRVDDMIENGLIKEVEGLIDYKDFNSLNTIGYTEILDYLENKSSLDYAVEKIKTNTRRYAKRQITWFKSNKSIKWYSDNYNFSEITEMINSYSTQRLI